MIEQEHLFGALCFLTYSLWWVKFVNHVLAVAVNRYISRSEAVKT